MIAGLHRRNPAIAVEQFDAAIDHDEHAVSHLTGGDDCLAVVKAFGDLPKQIDSIHSYEWGTNNSPEKLDKGFTHLFLVTFKDEAGREKYLPHPAHKAFVAKLLPILEEPMVIDYWAK